MRTKEIIVGNMFIVKDSMKFKDFNESEKQKLNLMVNLTGTFVKRNEKCYRFSISNSGKSEIEKLDWSYGIRGFEELEGWAVDMSYIPERLLKDHVEGDVITLLLPIVKNDFENQIKSETAIKVSVKLVWV